MTRTYIEWNEVTFLPGDRAWFMYKDWTEERNDWQGGIDGMRDFIDDLQDERRKLETEVEGYKTQLKAVDNIVKTYGVDGPLPHDRVFKLIKQLEAEIEQLKISIANHFATEHLEGDGPEIDRWRNKVKKLEVDNKKLREALTNIKRDSITILEVGGSTLLPDINALKNRLTGFAETVVDEIEIVLKET